MIVLGFILWAFFYYRHKTRSRLQDTIQTAIEKGSDLTPELIEHIAEPKPGPQRDLRRGIIGLAIGLAFIAFGLAVGYHDEEAFYAFLGIASFPIFVGIGYLIMHRLSGDVS